METFDKIQKLLATTDVSIETQTKILEMVTKEVTDFIGEDMLIGVGEYGIGFKLKEPNHHGNDRLTLTKGSVLVKYPNGQMSNAGLYRPEE